LGGGFGGAASAFSTPIITFAFELKSLLTDSKIEKTNMKINKINNFFIKIPSFKKAYTFKVTASPVCIS